MNEDMSIRKARPDEHGILTKISFASKQHWEYPDEYFVQWNDELTITEKYINDNDVFVYCKGGFPCAYYSLINIKQDFKAGEVLITSGYWLEHMFVSPVYINKGIGTILYNHLLDHCKQNKISAFKIFADPNAKEFYVKMGAVYEKEYPSSIFGRTVSLLSVTID
jgi:GNAT superfamily N-acetyltransferase